jgi:hypothetical protein
MFPLLRRVWSDSTYGSATLDIARSHIFDDAIESSAVESLLDDTRQTGEGTQTGAIAKHRFSSSGVRLKVMRHVTLGPERTQRVHGIEECCPIIDAAAGVSFELDSAAFKPKARVRVLRTVSIGAFPCAHVKVQRRIPIGLTGFSLKVMYFCPLRQLPRAFDAPARLLLCLDDTDRYGVRLVTNGVELAGNRVFHPTRGTRAVLLTSALLTFPSSLGFEGLNVELEERTEQEERNSGKFGVRLGRTALKFRF